jgi:hypothetical protein
MVAPVRRCGSNEDIIMKGKKGSARRRFVPETPAPANRPNALSISAKVPNMIVMIVKFVET